MTDVLPDVMRSGLGRTDSDASPQTLIVQPAPRPLRGDEAVCLPDED